MTGSREERALRDLFAEQREEDLRAAPAFERTIRARRAPHGARFLRRRFALAAAASIVVGIAAWQIADGPAGDEPEGNLAAELQRTAARWRSPTDFLLDRAGTDAWRGVPAIGRTRSSSGDLYRRDGDGRNRPSANRNRT